MKSSHEIAQKQKEAKVFIPFSKKKGLPEIKSLTGTVYPDGVMEYEGKCIAIEQTDFHLYIKNKRSCNQVFQSCLKEIRDELAHEGYTGCVGVKLKSGVIYQEKKG